MDDADELPGKKARPLDRLSVDELEARIEALQAEIAACKAELEKKRAQRSAADALFGGGATD